LQKGFNYKNSQTLLNTFTQNFGQCPSIFAADYETVYQCGFEDSENLSAWDLQTATDYSVADPTYLGYRDYFFVGPAASYMGSKSLYVSNNNGLDNTITATSNTDNTTSYVDLLITLEPGTYKLDFTYKKNGTGQLLDIFGVADRLDFNSYYLNIIPYTQPLADTDSWMSKSFEFTITETINWISFTYNFNTRNGGEELEGFAIDNILIQKEKETTSLTQFLNDSFSLTTQPKQITISGTDEFVSIWNINGQCMAKGKGLSSYAVPVAGIYIVRVGSYVEKVIVP
jgi:hypothetical protein